MENGVASLTVVTHLQNLPAVGVALEEVLNEVCQRRLSCAKVVITHVYSERGGRGSGEVHDGISLR